LSIVSHLSQTETEVAMRLAEVQAFAHWAAPQTVRDVTTEGALARNDWSARVRSGAELRDVAAFALGGWFCPRSAVAAAAEVAIKMAIIVALWPEEVGDVLRPSWG
jgi:hypothetical protein